MGAQGAGSSGRKSSPATALPGSFQADWIHFLTEEDLAFIKRFILASGSLKAVAQQYGISYPTVRLRLDRLIQKIRVVEEHRQASRFERLLRARFAEGKVDAETLRVLLQAYHEEVEGDDASAVGK